MPRRRGTPLHDAHGGADARFTTISWNAEGIATLEASGSDVRSALEAGLRATLTLVLGSGHPPPETNRSAPLQADAESIADLFANLAEDLLDQIDYFGAGLHDVVVDGVLRREGGGYVAWGYAAESATPPRHVTVPLLHEEPTIESTAEGMVIRASFVRSRATMR